MAISSSFSPSQSPTGLRIPLIEMGVVRCRIIKDLVPYPPLPTAQNNMLVPLAPALSGLHPRVHVTNTPGCESSILRTRQPHGERGGQGESRHENPE